MHIMRKPCHLPLFALILISFFNLVGELDPKLQMLWTRKDLRNQLGEESDLSMVTQQAFFSVRVRTRTKAPGSCFRLCTVLSHYPDGLLPGEYELRDSAWAQLTTATGLVCELPLPSLLPTPISASQTSRIFGDKQNKSCKQCTAP